MTLEQLRGWLLMQPRAESIRLTCGKDIRALSPKGQTFMKLAKTIEAMSPDLIEAVDAAGGLLRAVRPADVDDDDDAPPAATAIVPVVPFDAETERFKLVAQLLAEAHRDSYNALVHICDSNQRRAESLERTANHYERMRRDELEDRLDEARELAESAQAQGGPLAQLASQFLGGQQMGAAAAAKPNGAAKTPPNGKA
jgi:hypothetical protein